MKLLVTTRGLHHRRRNQALYNTGAYQPLGADGPRARNVVGFARALDGRASLTVVGRLFASLVAGGAPPAGEAWADTRLLLPPTVPHRRFRDVLTGGVVEADETAATHGLRLSDVLASLPVALLEPM